MKTRIAFIVTLFSCSTIFGSTYAFISEINASKVAPTSKGRAKRDVRSVTFEIDNKDYHFNFERSNRRVYSNNIPVYLMKSKPGSTPNYTYERIPNTEQMLSKGFFYVDNEKKAVAYVHYDEKNREIIYDGLFGEMSNMHLISSFPENQKYKLQRERQLRGEKLPDPRRKPLISAGKQERQSKRSYERSINSLEEKRAKRLDILYPKLLILVDSGLFKYHKRDIPSILKYVATFWNKVDQKYVELDALNIQLSVTGVIIADDENAFNFVRQGKLDPKMYGKDRWHSDYIFLHMRDYFQSNFSKDVDFQNYDAAVLMTAVDIRPYVGMTYPGVICSDSSNYIIMRDEGWFDGIQTGIHELAHALGALHDGQNAASGCPEQDNNKGVSMMSQGGGWGDYYYWSNCTKKYIQDFAKTKEAECMATRHRERHFDGNYK